MENQDDRQLQEHEQEWRVCQLKDCHEVCCMYMDRKQADEKMLLIAEKAGLREDFTHYLESL